MRRIVPFTTLDVATSSLQDLIDDGLVADSTMEVHGDRVNLRLLPSGSCVHEVLA